MRAAAKSLLVALAASASVLAVQVPVAAEELVLPPMTQDPVTGTITPTGQDEALVVNLAGVKLGLPVPRLPIPGLAGGGMLGFNGTPPASPTPRYSGYAIGVYADADLASLVKLSSGRVAASYVTPDGVNMTSGTVAYGETPWPLGSRYNLVGSGVGISTELGVGQYLSGETLVTELDGFGNYYVEGLHAKARAQRRSDGSCVVQTDFRLGQLDVLGMTLVDNKDVPTNTVFDVPGLGRVVVNEQKHVNLPGQKCGARLNAVHIELSTAQLGLPAGADLYVGAIEVIVHE